MKLSTTGKIIVRYYEAVPPIVEIPKRKVKVTFEEVTGTVKWNEDVMTERRILKLNLFKFYGTILSSGTEYQRKTVESSYDHTSFSLKPGAELTFQEAQRWKDPELEIRFYSGNSEEPDGDLSGWTLGRVSLEAQELKGEGAIKSFGGTIRTDFNNYWITLTVKARIQVS
jgi:hypothetical protein